MRSHLIESMRDKQKQEKGNDRQRGDGRAQNIESLN